MGAEAGASTRPGREVELGPVRGGGGRAGGGDDGDEGVFHHGTSSSALSGGAVVAVGGMRERGFAGGAGTLGASSAGSFATVGADDATPVDVLSPRGDRSSLRRALRGARRATNQLLGDAQLLLFGDESEALGALPGAFDADDAEDHGLGLERGTPSTESLGAPGPRAGPFGRARRGSPPPFKPLLVSFVGNLPTLMNHERSGSTFDRLVPTLDGLHESDEEAMGL